jgi:acylaminoacyl-peptidase
MASQGWTVIMPNYRGSKGFGETALQSLPGNIGSQDVEDSLAAVAEAHSKGLCGDPADVGISVVGGSHGGFLGCHFAGQFPNMVRAVAVRNPVCDISTMVASSDIPDWCCKEALGDKSKFTLCPSLEDLATMRACSPAAYVASAAAVPHLFCIGGADRRVPPSQGLLHGKILKEKGAKVVSTYMFPEDAHPLSRPRTNLQQWLLTLGFLIRHHCSERLTQ